VELRNGAGARQSRSALTVLLVAAYLPPVLGGVEKYVFNLGAELVRRFGCRVIIAATAPPDVRTSATEEMFAAVGLEVRWLPAFGKVSNTPVGIGWKRRLRQIIEDEKVDIVNAHGPVPLVADIAASACASVPFVLTYHSGPMRKGRRWVDIGLRLYESFAVRRTVRRSDAVICSSCYVRMTLMPPVAWPAEVIYPAVDPELFSPGGSPERLRVLFVATLSAAARYKGLTDLLDAVAILRDRGVPVVLEVVGDGDALATYKERACSNGISDYVIFSGSLVGRQLVEAYLRSAVVAVPSLFDNFPTVAVEAMACGRPVVATKVGALTELVVDGETGFIVPPGNPMALAGGLFDAMQDGKRAAYMGRNGRKHVLSRLSLTVQADRTMHIYQNVLARHAGEIIRVAVVTPYYPPRIGGVERYAERVATMLQASPGHEVVVICANDSPETQVETRDGVIVVRLGIRWTISNTPVNPAWVWQVRRALDCLKVDVVNTHSPVPFLADIVALFARSRPIVLTYHCTSLLKGRPFIDVFLALYERLVLPVIFKRCEGLVAVSPASMAYRFDHARLVQCGVDVIEFSPAADERRSGSTMLYVGRVERASRWKGVDVLIDAMPAIAAEEPDAQLEIVGSGDWMAELQDRAFALGIAERVTWRGVLNGRDLTDAYRRASVVVLPSLTDAECFGTVLIEAMACGRPVVASDVGGLPFTMRNHVDGLLVPPGDAQALANACLTILRDPDLADQMGASGRSAAIERWDWRKQMSKMVDFVDELAGAGTLRG
jgi:glycosyltransferase involved in cell wall biosynthesis